MEQRKIKRYGWRPSLPDPRDIPFKVSAPIPLPESIDLSPDCPPVYQQGELGSCTANAIGAAYEYSLMKQGKTVFTPSRLFLYWNERAFEGTISSDSGAMIRDGLKVLHKIGSCDEKIWPYDTDKFAQEPPSPCFVQGLKNRIDLYETLNSQNIYALKQCLAQKKPFVFGFTVFESFESDNMAETGIMRMPNINSESVLGGHAVMAVGYNDKTNFVKVRNSWGTSWGDKGYFYMPYQFITNYQLASDFWAIDAV